MIRPSIPKTPEESAQTQGMVPFSRLYPLTRQSLAWAVYGDGKSATPPVLSACCLGDRAMGCNLFPRGIKMIRVEASHEMMQLAARCMDKS